MTALAYFNGVIAADSRETIGDGDYFERCEKLFRRRINKRDVVVGTAGGSYLGMVFVDWLASGAKVPPAILTAADVEEDFEAIVLDRGRVYSANHLCRLVRNHNAHVVAGSGAKAALAALYCGRSAREAVRIACRLDPSCGLPVVTMQMPGVKK